MPKPPLCLNMIVRNESDRILRCLKSVSPYIKGYSITDTGSSDDTVDKILDYFEGEGIPGVVHYSEFKDFSQARNAAFRHARVDSKGFHNCQFALLVDADMELVVDDPTAFDDLDANALSYDMMQKGGAVSYGNRRLINLNWGKDPYVGVTHEYVDVPAAGMITGARFIDHADGSNRVEKYPRDAALLEAALKEDPKNGRYWYYLANTYKDWGKPHEASDAYEHRVSLGGWDEETHSAMMNLAISLKDADHADGFVSKMIAAYSFRPRRAEPLYELAKYYREKGDNAAALMFAKAGVKIKRPNDLLFVNDFVYDWGLRYEYSISGYYDEEERASAFAVTDDLALDPDCPEEYRNSARHNLYHFTKPLSVDCPSFSPTKLQFTPPAGYIAMNPSVEECNGHISCNIRCVNYKIDEHGRYMIGPKECHEAPIDTRNFVCKLDEQMNVVKAREVIWHRGTPNFNLVTGLEDMRLWRYQGELHFNACVRERSMYGTCQQVMGKLTYDVDDKFMTVAPGWKVLSGDTAHEKNWMHVQDFKFMYRLGTMVDHSPGRTEVSARHCPVYDGNISGSSQLVPFKGGQIAIVHEAIAGPDGKRTYWHRFAWWSDGVLRRLSKPFVFFDKQIEFCAGLAYHPDRKTMIISFGVRDAEAWVATIAIEEVAIMIWKFHED